MSILKKGGAFLKKIKRIISFFCALSLLLSLSSCSLGFSSFDELIRPPRLVGKYQGLQDLFEKQAGAGYTLCTPENGKYQSAFITFDVDSDSDEEALVFYTSKRDSELVKFIFFEYENDEWLSAGSYEGLGNSVDTVIFSDLNLDGEFEVIIGWNLFSSMTGKTFSFYRLSDKGSGLIPVNSYPYSYLSTIDVNGDGMEDVFSLNIDSAVPDHLLGYARVYNYNSVKSTLDILSETRTDGNVSGYSSVSTETADNVNYIYIEALKGEKESVTELIYWDDKTSSLISPLFDAESQTTKLSWRNIPITCFDIDGDERLEIPTSVEMKGYAVADAENQTQTNDAALPESMYYIKWVKFSGGRLRPVRYSVVNSDYGYILSIPSSWVGRITVVNTGSEWKFYRWLGDSGKYGDLLFSISAFKKSTLSSDKVPAKYRELDSSADYAYYFTVTDAGYSFGVKDATIKKEFIINDFGGIK